MPPRGPPDFPPLQDYNPWVAVDDVSDSEEEDIEEYIIYGPEGSIILSRIIWSSNTRGALSRRRRSSLPEDDYDPDNVLRDFDNMVGNIVGPVFRAEQPGRSGPSTIFPPGPLTPRTFSPHPLTRPLTYRVQYIPTFMSPDQVKKLFTLLDSQAVVVQSLAPALGSDEIGSQTARIEYKVPISGKKMPALAFEGKLLGIDADMDFIGLTPLNVADFPVRADVVAVTGLGGHALNSWSHGSQNGKNNWLRDYLPINMPHLRNWTNGYGSQLSGQESRETHAQDFASALECL